MAELKTEVRYVLTTPIKYHREGNEVEATFLTIAAPSSLHSRPCAVLKQAFAQAANEASKGVDESEVKAASAQVEEPDGPSVMMLLAMAGIDYSDVLEVGKTILAGQSGMPGLAMLDGVEKLTKPRLDELSLVDLEGAVGAFLAGFTVPSVLGLTSRS